VPLALGTVGGLTNLHPLAKQSLEMLGNPTAKELMMITSVMGLANNFSAVKSLTTKGIQAGHMKMHLFNILNHFKANDKEKDAAVEFFKDQKVSFARVGQYIASLRK
jgi:hydroxymethylglutaryl-CoA reductase